jgi:two-component system cell cycle response regulator CpdR
MRHGDHDWQDRGAAADRPERRPAWGTGDPPAGNLVRIVLGWIIIHRGYAGVRRRMCQSAPAEPRAFLPAHVFGRTRILTLERLSADGRSIGPRPQFGPEAMIRILLAEDDEAMRTYLARALHNAGYEVSPVDRGTAALALLETEHFDLLLSDIVMPEMDGIELAQRCNEVSPRTKVMFITGFAAVTLRASREAPQARVLSKPFHLRDLVMEVQRVFGLSEHAHI